MPDTELLRLLRRMATRGSTRSEATLQAEIARFLVTAPLNLDESDVEAMDLESPVGAGRRIDIAIGFTVIEVKRDLRVGRVREDGVEQLAGYVRSRTAALGQRYVGILTDGATWELHHLANRGLQIVATHTLSSSDPDVDAFCIWPEGVLATSQQIPPTSLEIKRRLGASSAAHARDFADLRALYEANCGGNTSVQLKRTLWGKLLTTALGTNFNNEDQLFVEHTLLVATAAVIAHSIIDFPPTSVDPTEIMSGIRFDRAQIAGVVEPDFFGWIREVDGGSAFVRTLARRVKNRNRGLPHECG